MKWRSEQVIEQVMPLDFEQLDQPLPELVQTYNRFYGLDFENRFEHLNHQVGSFQVDEFLIVAHVFKIENAKGTVFLQHGYYDHVGLYGHLIEHLLEQGYNVFSYDLPGHGLSSGERAGIQSFQQYDAVFSHGLNLIQHYLPGPIVAVGQSTGGAVIVNYLLSRGISRFTSPFEKVYLLAPLVRPVDWGRAVLMYKLLRPFTPHIKRNFAENSNNQAFLKFISEHDPLQPLHLKVSWVGALHQWIKFIESTSPVDLDVTIVQGTDDGTVDYKHNLKILQKKFSNCKITYIENGRHQLVNEELSKLQQVLAELTPLI